MQGEERSRQGGADRAPVTSSPVWGTASLVSGAAVPAGAPAAAGASSASAAPAPGFTRVSHVPSGVPASLSFLHFFPPSSGWNHSGLLLQCQQASVFPANAEAVIVEVGVNAEWSLQVAPDLRARLFAKSPLFSR